MKVQRVKTEWGSRIEPPLNQSWDDLTKLRWLASVVALDADVRAPRVEVSDYSVKRFGVWVRQHGYYDVERCGPLTLGDAWSYLNGIGAGALIAREGTT